MQTIDRNPVLDSSIFDNSTFEYVDCEDMRSAQPDDALDRKPILENSIWIVGILFWGIGITIRTITAFTDGHLSLVELSQLLAASLIFISWLDFKPVKSIRTINPFSRLRNHKSCSNLYQNDLYSCTTQARMTELQNYHMISQEYIFPFPYLCQIYHLLNLKHLENVHHFSLSNLKITKVSTLQPTKIGGFMKFQTSLDSPLNTLRIWRQPLVEVGLTLLTPYTVELNIPAYGDKHIIVLFNVVPLQENEHKLFIDIYSNLAWPKPILQILLHLASCLTVFEDLPYLRKLAERNLDRVVRSRGIPDHESMWLFKRFAELYGSQV